MYRDCVQVAKEVRAALKKAFPFTKFSVRSSRYSMGSSVHVSWDNMPTRQAVEEVIDQFSQVRYDEITGEILSGGNLFVSAQPDITKEFRAEVEKQMKHGKDDWYWYNKEFEEIVNRMYADFIKSQQPAKENKNKQVKTVNVSAENVTYTINKRLNGIEITFPCKPEQSIIDTLKVQGFRWSPRGFWWAKNTPERLSFAQSLCNVGTITEEAQEVEEVEEIEEHAQVEEVTTFSDETEYQAETIIEASANIIIENNFRPYQKPLTDEEFSFYVSKLSEFIKSRDFDITADIMAYIANNKALKILSKALETIQKPITATVQETQENTNNTITATQTNSNEFYINNSPVWSITAAQYQAYKGIKQPFICEISPYQMGRMSERQRKQYMKQRQAEWQTSAECKQTFKRLIIEAYQKGLFSLDSLDIHPETKNIILSYELERKKQLQEQAKAALLQANKISNNNQITVGLRVYSPLYGYGIVLKINHKTAILKLESGQKIKVPIFSLQLQSYQDTLKTMP
jgi:uncharacterized protein